MLNFRTETWQTKQIYQILYATNDLFDGASLHRLIQREHSRDPRWAWQASGPLPGPRAAWNDV